MAESIYKFLSLASLPLHQNFHNRNPHILAVLIFERFRIDADIRDFDLVLEKSFGSDFGNVNRAGNKLAAGFDDYFRNIFAGELHHHAGDIVHERLVADKNSVVALHHATPGMQDY